MVAELSESNSERRGYFRVEDEVLLQFELIPPQGIPRLREVLDARLPNAFSLSSQFNELRQANHILQHKLEKESPGVMRYLALLEHKIDKLAEVLVVNEMPGALLQPVNLGADGMGFLADHALPLEGLLDVRLGLLSSGRGLHCLGEVRRCESAPGGGFQIGIRFEYLNPADKELLVQHVLHRQQVLLRQRRD